MPPGVEAGLSLADSLVLPGEVGAEKAEGNAALPVRRVVVLDGERALRRALALFLVREGFEVDEATSPAEVLEILLQKEVSVLVAEMPPAAVGALDFVEEARARRPEIEVVLTTAASDPHLAIEALRRGAFEVVRKPFLLDELTAAVRSAWERRELRVRTLELERMRERERMSERTTMQVLSSMATLLDAKSPFTREHSDRVSEYATRLAQIVGLPEGGVRIVGFGAKVHDIGKIGIADAVLNKPGRLTKEERDEMRRHPEIGEQCLAPVPMMRPFVCMVGGHHENFDGSGYPRGLPGSETPVETRIVKIADYFDAITSLRPYRRPLPLGRAITVLRNAKKDVLDADLVEAFVRKVLGAPKRS